MRTIKDPNGNPYVTVEVDGSMLHLRLHTYDPEVITVKLDRRIVPELATILYELRDRPFQVGDRIVVKRNAGFHRGAHGVIKYVEPTGKVWVLRDGASSDVWYNQDEIEFEPVEKQSLVALQ